MASRKVFSLKEIDSIINADDFFDSDDEENDNSPTDIVEIPPEMNCLTIKILMTIF